MRGLTVPIRSDLFVFILLFYTALGLCATLLARESPGRLDPMVTLYSTPTCAPCRVAESRLDDAGLLAAKVDLTQDPEKVEELKARLGVPVLQTPILEFEGELFGIADLRAVMETASGQR
jgi:glutaredoxin